MNILECVMYSIYTEVRIAIPVSFSFCAFLYIFICIVHLLLLMEVWSPFHNRKQHTTLRRKIVFPNVFFIYSLHVKIAKICNFEYHNVLYRFLVFHEYRAKVEYEYKSLILPLVFSFCIIHPTE
jgi:hypothetical protein